MVASGNDIETLEDTGGLLREVARLHVRAQREQVACCRTTVAQCQVLTELGRGGPLPMTEIVRRLGLHKGWISRAVASLVEEGLLERAAGCGDGRVIIVGLSRAGQQRVRALNRALDRQAARVLGHLARSDRATVHRALKLVREALRQELRLPGDGQGAGIPPRKDRS